MPCPACTMLCAKYFLEKSIIIGPSWDLFFQKYGNTAAPCTCHPPLPHCPTPPLLANHICPLTLRLLPIHCRHCIYAKATKKKDFLLNSKAQEQGTPPKTKSIRFSTYISRITYILSDIFSWTFMTQIDFGPFTHQCIMEGAIGLIGQFCLSLISISIPTTPPLR